MQHINRGNYKFSKTTRDVTNEKFSIFVSFPISSFSVTSKASLFAEDYFHRNTWMERRYISLESATQFSTDDSILFHLATNIPTRIHTLDEECRLLGCYAVWLF
jgi:hypothetical protein